MQSVSGLRRGTEGLAGHKTENGDEGKAGTRYNHESATYTEATRAEVRAFKVHSLSQDSYTAITVRSQANTNRNIRRTTNHFSMFPPLFLVILGKPTVNAEGGTSDRDEAEYTKRKYSDA